VRSSLAEETSELNPNEEEFELPEWLAEFSEDLEVDNHKLVSF
jgi:hypothetical protein